MRALQVHVGKKELLIAAKFHMRDLLQLGLDAPFGARHISRLPPQLMQVLVRWRLKSNYSTLPYRTSAERLS